METNRSNLQTTITNLPEVEEEDCFLTKMSVKLPSVGGVVNIGVVYRGKILKFKKKKKPN